MTATTPDREGVYPPPNKPLLPTVRAASYLGSAPRGTTADRWAGGRGRRSAQKTQENTKYTMSRWQNHGERLAGVGFWLHDDRVAGTLFEDQTDAGARHLAMWGMLQGGRLPSRTSRHSSPQTRAVLAEAARRDAPIHALMDRVVDRRLRGPTEFTTEEIEMLFPSPSDPEQVLGAQRMLQQVGITWPGSPELPEPPKPTGRNPFLPRP